LVDDGTREPAVLRALADLCGRLLLREPTAADLELLQRSDVRAALEDLGVDVPEGPPGVVLEDLARQYQECFPAEGPEPPPVASLWRGPHAGGDSAAAARSAELAAGISLDRGAAPADHLGHLLRLWARADESAPLVADLLRADHLAWGIDALQSHALGDGAGFYPSVARATIAVLADLTGPGPTG